LDRAVRNQKECADLGGERGLRAMGISARTLAVSDGNK
jgi:hypothetical protein